ncbi:MAG: hypothetical protein E6G10_00110 [Actinobacteria bacterium]|nr:MAG: hypothetical protein E6G10_00110 [Actinomycetota bacterium]
MASEDPQRQHAHDGDRPRLGAGGPPARHRHPGAPSGSWTRWTVLRWRYRLDGEELQPEEMARRLGLSTRRVQEIERRARAKLAAAERAGRGAPAA